MSAAEGQVLAKMTVKTLQLIRDDRSFDLFWECTKKKAENMKVDEPRLPRRRKLPRRYADCLSHGEFHDTPASFYKQIYFEALDLMINCIKQRFDQPGYRIFQSMESHPIKACMRDDFESELKEVYETYQDDWDKDLLQSQLLTLGVSFKHQAESNKSITVVDGREYLQNQSYAQLSRLSQVSCLMQLLLVMPATTALSERSFSALRRVKTYLHAKNV